MNSEINLSQQGGKDTCSSTIYIIFIIILLICCLTATVLSVVFIYKNNMCQKKAVTETKPPTQP